MILTLRTDKPEAEVGLYADNKKVTHETWHAHRELAATIHLKIDSILEQAEINWGDIDGIIFYEGPGSFTGLRIGASVANALKVPISNQTGDDWIIKGLKEIEINPENLANPKYGSQPHITKPKK